MGKIRVKSLGIDELEKEQVEQTKKRKEGKAARLAQGKKLAKGAHGGERLVSLSPTEEEIVKEIEKGGKEEGAQEKVSKEGKVSKVSKAPRQRSRRYKDSLIQVDKSKRYPLSESVTLLKEIGAPPAGGKFDATVELHINTTEKGISGQVSLPHGTGKKTRVVIANPSTSSGQALFEKLIANIEKGVIEFDVLIATPTAMPQLAKVAKILGPRGIMPNPKAGTISDKPEVVAKKFEGGAINFHTEAQAPIIHAVVGKVSFSQKDLEENIAAFLRAVGTARIANVTLKSTMSPGIKIDFTSI